MAKKSNTGLYVGIAVVVVVIAIVVGVIIANNNKGGSSDDGSNTQTSSLAASELSDNVSKTIMYGEFDEMQTLSKSIQNGEIVGEVVKIDGLVSRPGTIYNIVQKSEDGTKKIGTKFVIEGMDEANYPKDGTRVVITGKVVEESPMVYIIKTIPSMVEVQE